MNSNSKSTSNGPPQKEITVRRFSESYIDEHRDRFNTSNRYLSSDTKDARPDDYWEVADACRTGGWIDQFHATTNYRTFTIPSGELRWIQSAIEAGSKTAHFPRTFVEELDDCCARLGPEFERLAAEVMDGCNGNNSNNNALDGPRVGVFVRSERVSLKAGQHREGPYRTLRQVLESVVTATLSHGCVREDDREGCRLYLLPWKNNLDPENEFRVFVVDHEITGISQQVWSKRNAKWGGRSDSELTERLVRPLLEAFETNIRDHLRYLNRNYTMDVCFLNDKENDGDGAAASSLYFIEPNGFGAHYSAGSSLFHWENDEGTLMDTSRIELRIVDRD